jgi:acetyl-CoA carboxylase biotin carboxylase subunit
MNTRIQVEHPVTEMVTGIDLVQWQIRIAAGEALTFSQEDVALSGHAIECRITSEDPTNSFLPSTGRISYLEVPTGPGVRWDGGVGVGYEVGLHYDPMLAKLIVHAPTRELAIERMRRALRELRVVGVETSVPFHLAVMTEPEFRAGQLDIQYLDRHLENLSRIDLSDEDRQLVALAAAMLEHQARAQRGGGTRITAEDRGMGSWRGAGRGSWRGK